MFNPSALSLLPSRLCIRANENVLPPTQGSVCFSKTEVLGPRSVCARRWAEPGQRVLFLATGCAQPQATMRWASRHFPGAVPPPRPRRGVSVGRASFPLSGSVSSGSTTSWRRMKWGAWSLHAGGGRRATLEYSSSYNSKHRVLRFCIFFIYHFEGHVRLTRMLDIHTALMRRETYFCPRFV